MMNISLPGGRIGCGGTLALPVEQALVDGIVVVHGGGRIVFICLVQCYKEHVQLFLRQPLHTLAHGCKFCKVHRYQQLVAGVSAMEIQRTVETQFHWFVNKVNLLIPVAVSPFVLLPSHQGDLLFSGREVPHAF